MKSIQDQTGMLTKTQDKRESWPEYVKVLTTALKKVIPHNKKKKAEQLLFRLIFKI